MWDFSATSPSQDGSTNNRRNSLKQLFRGNTTALERSNWACKTGENHAIDDRTRNFLGIQHAESEETFVAAAEEEKRSMRKSSLSPSALLELQSLPYKTVAEQLGSSRAEISSIRKHGEQKKGKHTLLQPSKDAGGWFGSFTTSSSSGGHDSTEKNGNDEQYYAPASLDNDAKEDENDDLDNDDMIAMNSVCSYALEIDPHHPPVLVKPIPNPHPDFPSSSTATIPTTTAASVKTTAASSSSPVTNSPQPLYSALKRYNSSSLPTSPSRHDDSAVRPTRSMSVNGRIRRNVEFRLGDGEETFLSGPQQEQRPLFETGKCTINDDDIDDDNDTPVNPTQWGCGIDTNTINAAMLMTSSSSSPSRPINVRSPPRDLSSNDLLKPFSSQDGSNEENHVNGTDSGSDRHGVILADLDSNPPSLDDSWSETVVTALLSPRYLIPDLGIFYGQGNDIPEGETKPRDVMQRNDSGSGNSSSNSGKSSSSEKSVNASDSGEKTGDSGNALPATGNEKNNTKTSRRNTDSFGHFLDSVRASGGSTNGKTMVKKGGNDNHSYSGKGESSG